MKIKRVLVILLVLALVVSYSTPIYASKIKYCTVTFNYDTKTFKKIVRYGESISMNGDMFTHPLDKLFVKWDKSLKNIKKNMTVNAIFRDYVPHVVFSKTVATGDKFNFGTNINTYSDFKTSWSSSNKAIATVSSRGVVSTLKEGSTTITFKAYKKGVGTTYFQTELRVSDKAIKTPYIAVENFEDNAIEYLPGIVCSDTLTVGETVKLNKLVDVNLGDEGEGDNVYYTVHIETDDDEQEIPPNITCSEKGTVTAISEGTTSLLVSVWDYHQQFYRDYIIIYTVVGAE